MNITGAYCYPGQCDLLNHTTCAGRYNYQSSQALRYKTIHHMQYLSNLNPIRHGVQDPGINQGRRGRYFEALEAFFMHPAIKCDNHYSLTAWPLRIADVDSVAHLESFRALKLTLLESFRALKLLKPYKRFLGS